MPAAMPLPGGMPMPKQVGMPMPKQVGMPMPKGQAMPMPKNVGFPNPAMGQQQFQGFPGQFSMPMAPNQNPMMGGMPMPN